MLIYKTQYFFSLIDVKKFVLQKNSITFALPKQTWPVRLGVRTHPFHG